MLNWANWHTEIITILEKLNNNYEWEKVFTEFYVNNTLTDPLILVNKKKKLESCYKIITNLENLYKQIISKMSNIKNITKNPEQIFNDFINFKNDDKTNLIKNYHNILKYKLHEIILFPINPFNLGITSYRFKWIKLFNKVIPNNFKISWNTLLYSDFQIKINSNSNVFFTISNNIIYRILKYNSCTIYIFERNKNESNILDNNLEIQFKTELINKEKNINDNNNIESIYFSFNQDQYMINYDVINSNIYKIELLLDNFITLKKTLNLEIEQNNNDIEVYKNKFNIKKKYIQQIVPFVN